MMIFVVKMFNVYKVLYEIFRNIAIAWMNLFYKNTCVL